MTMMQQMKSLGPNMYPMMADEATEYMGNFRMVLSSIEKWNADDQQANITIVEKIGETGRERF